MKEEIPGQGRTPKQYSDSMKIIFIAVLGLLISLAFLSCEKKTDCTVTKIYTGDQRIVTTNVTNQITVLQIETDYVVVLECY